MTTLKRREGAQIYNRWRPRTFSELVGNEAIVRSITALLKRKDPPRSWMFSGPSGVGKTTMARLIAAYLNCSNGSIDPKPCGDCCSPCVHIFDGTWSDCYEVNAADTRGIDDMRELIKSMSYFSINQGAKKVYVLDEVHQLTKDAANAILKIYEEGFGQNFMILCTTEPQKVIETLRTRAVSFVLSPWSADQVTAVAKQVFAGEGLKVNDSQVAAFVGRVFDLGIVSPRAVLTAIDKVVTSHTLSIISPDSFPSEDVLSICRGVMNGRWDIVSEKWKAVDETQADSVRLAVCAYLKKVVLGGQIDPKGLAAAEALRDLSYRVDDSLQQNNVVARLYLATARMCVARRSV